MAKNAQPGLDSHMLSLYQPRFDIINKSSWFLFSCLHLDTGVDHTGISSTLWRTRMESFLYVINLDTLKGCPNVQICDENFLHTWVWQKRKIIEFLGRGIVLLGRLKNDLFEPDRVFEYCFSSTM